MKNLNVISLGAGKQSTYMLLTALEGKYKTKPDIAVLATLDASLIMCIHTSNGLSYI